MEAVLSPMVSAGSEAFTGERRQVTVLFSDLSAFTDLAERNDPEDVRALLGRLFGEAAQVVADCGGHIDGFVGDAVMALFGTPRMHEDDPIRALRAAREIHRRASRLTATDRAGRSVALRMHSGVATGVVVVTHGQSDVTGDLVLGDTVNVASRLTELAGPGEIVVAESTYELACGHFDFDPLGSVMIRGRTEPVRAFRLRRPRRDPETTHRLTGLRAELIGRERELSQLEAAAKSLLRGSSMYVGLTGEAGMGKSRLVAEFRSRDVGRQLMWREAHCYEYATGIPFGALLDLLDRAWDIDPGDDVGDLHAKIYAGLERTVDVSGGMAARVGRLWGMESPLLQGVDPESWRAQLCGDLARVFESIASRAPTVLLVEDLQWADDASMGLLRDVLGRMKAPVMVLCTHRPGFDAAGVDLGQGRRREQIMLEDLEPEDCVRLACSLLGVDEVPADLERFVRIEIGGNPFHIEESVNMLVDTGALVVERGEWRLRSPLVDLRAPLTVRSSIAARVDLLDDEAKRVIQAAAVVGRVFSADMLSRIVPTTRDVGEILAEIEQAGFANSIGDPGERMYAFRHVLTQDAIVEGLLKEERRAIHERTAHAYETTYSDRLPEFYETIAFHLKQGQVDDEAVRYLVRAGEKSLDRYAVTQASRYFRQAYELVQDNPSLAEDAALVADLLVRWARVEYYRGDFLQTEPLMLSHLGCLSAVDPELCARYETQLGMLEWHRQRLSSAREHLERGRAYAEECGSDPLIGFADAELAYVHADFGQLAEAIRHADLACAAARRNEGDAFLWEEAYAGAGYTHWCTGRVAEERRLGEELLAYGASHANVRCLTFGHWIMALAHLNNGDFPAATVEIDQALSVSADPWMLQFPKFFSAICLIFSGDFDRALPLVREVYEYSSKRGAETLSIPARGLLGAALAGTGSLDRGIAMLVDCERRLRHDERVWAHANAVFILGELHAVIARREGPVSVGVVLRNPKFLVRHAPAAASTARRYLAQAARQCDEFGALGMAGQCWLTIAELEHAKHHAAEAVRAYENALDRFAACGAGGYAESARAGLAQLAHAS